MAKGELLALPGGSIPPGWLTEFFVRKAAMVHQKDTDELTLLEFRSASGELP